MPERPAKKLFPNPFYVLLLLASTAFVVTIFGYLIAPTIQQQAMKQPARAGSLAVAEWFDAHGPVALGVEFVVMLVAAFLAMATDRWFPEKPPKKDASSV